MEIVGGLLRTDKVIFDVVFVIYLPRNIELISWMWGFNAGIMCYIWSNSETFFTYADIYKSDIKTTTVSPMLATTSVCRPPDHSLHHQRLALNYRPYLFYLAHL